MSRQWPRLRRRPVPARRPLRSTAEAPEDPVPRIDALTSAGRANWLALLGYLAFVMVTTLGVEDIDFFVDSRQTQLPLVNVSIPTFSFFVFAPILGTALYAYLHLHVRKVTEALAVDWTAPQPLEERIKPWLLNDFVLRQRADRDRVIRPRPLDWLARLTTLLLVWWAGPIVLCLMWARTWPAHELWLSLLCAACLMLSVYAGALSWTKMRQDLDRWGQRATAITTAAAILLCLPVLWLTTANSKGIWEYVIELPAGEKRSRSTLQRAQEWANNMRDEPTTARPDKALVWMWDVLTGLARLDAPDLTAARLSVLPPEEADLDTARQRYRKGFCERRGIDLEICDRAPSASYDLPSHVAQKRQSDWCDPRGYVDGAMPDCAGFFAGLDAAFDREWTAYRGALIASVAKPVLRGKDLRRAVLAQAELSGIDFRRAQMEGADLRGAQMEGADLRGAQMEGAYLVGAQMEGADLGGAQMEGVHLELAKMKGADLLGARMEGAKLRWTQMEGAYLVRARMEGADLLGMQMEGANLFTAQMDGAYLVGVQMEGAYLVGAQMEGANLSMAQMKGANLGGAHMDGANLYLAQMEGVNLRAAHLKSVNWDSGKPNAALAHSTDFRGSATLTQDLLLPMLGDEATLLPDTGDPATGETLYIPSCWVEEPDGWRALIKTFAPVNDRWAHFRKVMSKDEMRAVFLCSTDRPLCKTGTPWPLDKPPPEQSELRQPYDCVAVE